jgi:hypothetical protein
MLAETGTEYRVAGFADIEKACSAVFDIHNFSMALKILGVNYFGRIPKLYLFPCIQHC